MPFFYFSESPEQIESLRESRFWDLKTDGGLCRQSVDVGPNGNPGHLLYYAPFGTQLKTAGYSKDGQEWIDCGDWWLGWEKGKKPGPEELERGSLVSGYDRILNDGKGWHCPTARRWTQTGYMGNVPVVRTLIGGKKGVKLKLEYQEMWELSATVWNQFQQREVDGFEQFEMCVTFLAVNYRVGAEECSVLELFDDSAVVEVIKAVIDYDMIEELKKKELQASE